MRSPKKLPNRTLDHVRRSTRGRPCRCSRGKNHVVEKLEQLRTELADLAYRLETLHQMTAADVAVTISALIGEICEELHA